MARLVNLGAFVATVGGLVGLMAALFLAPMFAALYMFCIVGAVLCAVHVADLLRTGQWSWRHSSRRSGGFSIPTWR